MATKPTAPVVKAGAPAVPQTTLSQAMQASMRKFTIIAVTGTVLIALVGGYFIYLLVNQNIKLANEVTAQGIYNKLAQQKVEVLNEAEKKLVDLNNKDNKVASDYELVTSRALPNMNDLGSLLTIFQKLETTTLVKIESVSKSLGATGVAAVAPTVTGGTAASSVGKASPFQVGFKATGTYDQIMKMLRALETSTRVFDFTNLKIGGTSQSITLDMTYQVYYLPDQVPTDTKIPIGDYKPEAAK